MVIALVLFSLIFLIRSQPVFIVIVLIFITLIYSLYVMINLGGFWFRYIIILVILRGVIVVFIYIASLIPNERFEFLSLFLFLFFIFILIDNFFMINDRIIDEISLKIWRFDFYIYNIFLIVFLFSVILMVVWLRCTESGVIRVILLCAWFKRINLID